MKPSLLIISFSEISKDARVLKQVRGLLSDYRVTTCGFGDAPLDEIEHVRVDGPRPAVGLVRRYVMGALDGLAVLTHNYHWTHSRIPYVDMAKRRLRGRVFDVVLANDVDTLPVALTISNGSRVHADLHEFFPGIHDNSTVLGRRQSAYLTWLVNRYATRAASSTTVSWGIADAYRKYGLKCEVVTNATPWVDQSPGEVGPTIKLVHSGNAQPSRQLELAMTAAAQTSTDVTLDLFLMPNDLVYLSRLRDLADELGPRVRIMDPLPQSELVTALNRYDVGVHVLPPTSFNNANALPNKFFDYVQSRLGLVIGPSPEMRRLLDEYGCGAVTDDFTVDAIRMTFDELTVEAVTRWKYASDSAAEPLSAGYQVAVWIAAIERLALV
jgi:glycosyltransferase involved in cell wall biosynthesis